MSLDFPATLDLKMKVGDDRPIPLTFSGAGVGWDFTGCAAQLFVNDACGKPQLLLSTTPNAYGSIYLGTPATGDRGVAVIRPTRLLTQVTVLGPRQGHNFYVTWSTGARWCVLTGTLYLISGAPYG